MRHTFLDVTVNKLLKSVYIYGSYRKIKTGVSRFWTVLYIFNSCISMSCIFSHPSDPSPCQNSHCVWLTSREVLMSCMMFLVYLHLLELSSEMTSWCLICGMLMLTSVVDSKLLMWICSNADAVFDRFMKLRANNRPPFLAVSTNEKRHF